MRHLRRIADRALRFVEDDLPGLILLVAALTVCLDVFLRYVFRSPIQGVSEVILVLLVWQVMLGAASVARTGGHVSVDIIPSLLRGRARAVLDLVRMGITIAVLVALAWFGLEFFFATARREIPMVGLPRGWVTIAVPIGAVLMIAHYGRDLIAAGRGLLTGQYTPADRWAEFASEAMPTTATPTTPAEGDPR